MKDLRQQLAAAEVVAGEDESAASQALAHTRALLEESRWELQAAQVCWSDRMVSNSGDLVTRARVPRQVAEQVAAKTAQVLTPSSQPSPAQPAQPMTVQDAARRAAESEAELAAARTQGAAATDAADQAGLALVQLEAGRTAQVCLPCRKAKTPSLRARFVACFAAGSSS
jgi:hypothetical protein